VDQYRATVDAVRAAAGGELPEGFHAGGPTEGGILIVAVHESKEAAERFLRETLMPTLPVEGGFEGRPEERAAEIVAL
jgi:hypothetical protein